MRKNLDENYTRMPPGVLNKSWKQHPTKQLNSHSFLILQTIQIRQTRHAEHCWRSNDELTSYVLLWTPIHGHTSVSQQVWTYTHLLWADIGCSLEDLPSTMADRERESKNSVLIAWFADDHDIYVVVGAWGFTLMTKPC